MMHVQRRTVHAGHAISRTSYGCLTGLPIRDRVWGCSERSPLGLREYALSDIVVATRLAKRPLGLPSTLMAGGAHDAHACAVGSRDGSNGDALNGAADVR